MVNKDQANGPWADFLPLLDGVKARGAHSCGAVADLNRLPEHPGDDCGERGCRSKRVATDDAMEAISMTSTFIADEGRQVKRESDGPTP